MHDCAAIGQKRYPRHLHHACDGCSWARGSAPMQIHELMDSLTHEFNRTAGQGGPKTLPAALWQACMARRVLRRNTEAVGPVAFATGRLSLEQPRCHTRSLEKRQKTPESLG